MEKDQEPCPLCRGWGFVLGTDTPDKWGELCPNLCDINYPISKAEKVQLQAAHDRAGKGKK